MPVGETTSTNPVGILSAIFPGPVFIHPRSDGLFYLRENPEVLRRGRLCEQVWLEPEIFGLRPDGLLYAIAEETYANRGSTPHPVSPGSFGEQLLIREVDWSAIQAGKTWQIADARLQVMGVIWLYVNETRIQAVHLRIVEQGLVEPGAQIQLL